MQRIFGISLVAIFFISTICLAFLTACEDEEVTRSYARIDTHDVANISSEGATFSANLISKGNSEITSIGFVWGIAPDLLLDVNEFFILDKDEIKASNLRLDIRTTLVEGTEYYVRSFLTQGETTVYGDLVSFISLGSSSPNVTSIEPTMGTVGDTVIINGVNFSNRNGSNIIKFGNSTLTTISDSDSLIKVVIPNSFRENLAKVSVSIVGNQSEEDVTFNLSTPIISEFSPQTATDLDEIIIYGENFAWKKELNLVLFDGINVPVLHSNKTELTVKVPAGITKKQPSIALSVAEKSVSVEGIFEMLPPTITDFTPKSGVCGETITINGENFGTLLVSNKVFFGDKKAVVESVSKTQLLVIVPAGLGVSNKQLRVETVNIETQANTLFSSVEGNTVVEINSVSPSIVSTGDQLIIQGLNFSTQNNQVTFNGISGVVSSQSSTQIITSVPVGLGDRNVEVTVQFDEVCAGQSNPIEIEYIGGIWSKEGTQFPGIARSVASNFQIGNKGYFGLGKNQFDWFDDIWEYDLETNNWTQKADFPGGARFGATYLSIGNKGYVGLGFSESGIYMNDFWEYNPFTDSWLQLADFPGEARADVARFAIGDEAYVGLGRNANSAFNDFYKFNSLLGTWSQIANLPASGRALASEFIFNQYAYIGLGVTSSGIRLNDMYKYDAVSNIWTSLMNFPGEPREGASSFIIHNKAYLCFGYNQNQTRLSDTWEYNLDNETWYKSQTNPYGGGTHDVPILYNNKAYFLWIGKSGGGTNYTRDFQAFAPF